MTTVEKKEKRHTDQGGQLRSVKELLGQLENLGKALGLMEDDLPSIKSQWDAFSKASIDPKNAERERVVAEYIFYAGASAAGSLVCEAGMSGRDMEMLKKLALEATTAINKCRKFLGG